MTAVGELLGREDLFWRLHVNPKSPCFCAEHAWSGLWGPEYSADGSKLECTACDGSGDLGELNADGDPVACRGCDGDGWMDADRGYSCCDSAEELAAYFRQQCVSVGMYEKVVAFTGRRVGTSPSGEPLVVPDGAITEWTTFGEMLTAMTLNAPK